MWHMSPANEIKFLQVAKIAQKSFAPGAAEIMFMGESEQLDVVDTNSESIVSHDGIELTTSRLRLTDKIAASFALMTAVRLNVVEKKIERQLHIERLNIEQLKKRMRYGKLVSATDGDVDTCMYTYMYMCVHDGINHAVTVQGQWGVEV
eukprot:GHVS01098921.1.p1 GENE.GHVS01098921.1~~GHVS01098921.1.p1  ORF type:complete len:149 (-),score=20.17 GHVS01098921.1:130-576(-)